MSATRSRKEEKTYKSHLKSKNPDCDFCQIKKGSKQFVKQTRSFKVIRNIFPYSIWDGQRVADHLMVIPKKHTDSLGSLSNMQSAEFIKLIESYEKKDYNIYARAPSSQIKSVVHQHTHLIKTVGPAIKFLFLVRRPFYFRIPK